jgi:hypothetical protein
VDQGVHRIWVAGNVFLVGWEWESGEGLRNGI